MRKTIAKRRKRTTSAAGKKKAVATKPRAKKSSGKPGRSGRLPSAIREHCRGSFAERVAILEAIADGKPLPTTKIVGAKIVKIQVSAAIKERAPSDRHARQIWWRRRTRPHGRRAAGSWGRTTTWGGLAAVRWLRPTPTA